VIDEENNFLDDINNEFSIVNVDSIEDYLNQYTSHTIKGENFDICEGKLTKENTSFINKYIFIDCHFNDLFELYIDTDKKVDFYFEDCTFENFHCEVNGEIKFLGNISFVDTTHSGDIKFKNRFLNRIYLKDIKGDCLLYFSGAINKNREKYKDIIIFNSKIDVSIHNCSVRRLLIDNVNKVSLNDVSIRSKLAIKNIGTSEEVYDLDISNLDLKEYSKVLFESLFLNKLIFSKVSQDVKYMQFNDVTVNKIFLCKKVEFKNTYFNSFDIQNAKKEISKTSFIDAHFNDVNWGNIPSIKAKEATFRQLKFVNDTQGSHLIANQFYAMEMRKYKDSVDKTSWKDNGQEKIVIWLNYNISNFGQNYMKPFWLILITLEIQNLLYCSYKSGGLFSEENLLSNNYLKIWLNFLNNSASNYLPMSRFLEEGREAVSLVFLIMLSIFTWHFIVALKRNVKR